MIGKLDRIHLSVYSTVKTMEKETLDFKDFQPYGVMSLAYSVIEDASRRLGFNNVSRYIPTRLLGPLHLLHVTQ